MRHNMAPNGFCSPYYITRKKCMAIVLALVVSSLAVLFFVSGSSPYSREEMMEEHIAVMQTRLQFLEAQYVGKQEEIYNIQVQVNEKNITPHQVSTNDVPNSMFSPEVVALLKNISGSRAAEAAQSPERPNVIKAPFSLRLMPHLMLHPDSLRAAYHLKSNRNYVEYIIGIPTVKRDKESYLIITLEHLLSGMTADEKNDTMIVVMVGETDLEYVIAVTHAIETAFSMEMEAGLIEVISPSKHYYPDFNALAQTLGDSPKRVKWRTKQNLDAIFLMAYTYSKCVYYLMLEDDVIANDHYMTEIRKYTATTSVTSNNWFFIQFSATGGIGKLFRSSDLLHFINYVQLFYSNMPIDWLLESYLADKICGIEKTSKKCEELKNSIRPNYKNNLFQHVGLFSSLKGKIQKVKGPYDTAPAFFPHKNPELKKIKCDIVHKDDFTIDRAYNGVSFFWGKNPNAGDVIEFWFEHPTSIENYLFRSGSNKHTNDKLYDTVVEVLSSEPNSNFTIIANFDEFGLAEGRMDPNFGLILAMRLRVETASKFWVLITEIEIVTLEKDQDT